MIKHDFNADIQGYKFTPYDYLMLEVGTQIQRLKYAWTIWRQKTHCDFFPRKICIEPTSFCNLKCIHCPHGASPDSKERMTRTKVMMDFDLYKKVVDECAEHRRSTKIVFALLGEPTIQPKLLEMVAYASRKKVWTQVNTNCTQLTRDYSEKLIDAGLNMIYLSLDGINKETYERIRLKSDFDVVINNILTFLEVRAEKKAFDMTVHIGMTGEIINKKEIDVFVREFRKLPIDAVYSPLLFNWNGAIEWANPELKNLQTEHVENYPVCNTSFDICAIYSNGDFLPCIYDYDGKYVSGNVTNDSIMNLWNNERTRNFREAVLTRDYKRIEEKGKLCSECTILWNPQYQLNFSLGKNLAPIGRYLKSGVSTYFDAEKKAGRLQEKYQYLKEHREDFLENLTQQQAQSTEFYEKVKEDGVLRLKA